ncbi:MAG: DUF72 domain-containing protein [Acidimicrobiales bacterium]
MRSGWYPEGAASAEDRLRFYATRFPLVEVDSSYYYLPSERNAELWAKRSPPGFRFNVKAFSLLTGHPTRADALPKGIPVPQGKSRVYAQDLEPEVVSEVWDRFLSALAPLAEAGKLGSVLLQFPPWLGISRAAKEQIMRCASRCQPLRTCVELRNATWFDRANARETLDFLEGHGLGYVAVDMPQGFASSVPPLAVATAELATVRFHGRNASEWESGSVQRRFRYLYSAEELAQWVPRIRSMAGSARETHVLMNNCHSDYAQRNATQLAAMLRDAGADVAGQAGLG